MTCYKTITKKVKVDRLSDQETVIFLKQWLWKIPDLRTTHFYNLITISQDFYLELI